MKLAAGELRLVFLLLAGAPKSHAVVIDSGNGSGNTNAPVGNAGWSYVGGVNGASGVYLGESGGTGWVLTANHVGFGNFTIDGLTYSAVAGSGRQIGTIDLYAFQITVGSGSGLSLLSNLTLASASPDVGETLTMVGIGLNRAVPLTTWYVDTTPSTWIWSTSNFPGEDATAQGFQELGTSTKRWGTNNSDGTFTINSTSMIQTTFSPVTGHGTEVALGDSGGGMFTAIAGGYQLSGIIDLKGTYSGQPDNTAVFGDTTYGINVAGYRNQIIALTGIPEPQAPILVLVGFAFLTAVLRLRRQGV